MLHKAHQDQRCTSDVVTTIVSWYCFFFFTKAFETRQPAYLFASPSIEGAALNYQLVEPNFIHKSKGMAILRYSMMSWVYIVLCFTCTYGNNV